MPYALIDLEINRVDLVDEGSCSAAFIELYKRKEQCNMNFEDILKMLKPEHASVVQAEIAKYKEQLDSTAAERDTAQQEVAKAKEDLAKAAGEIEVLKKKKYCECDGKANSEGVCETCGGVKKAAFDDTETLKSMPESARTLFEKMRAQKEAAEEELRKAKDAEKHAEAIAKAKELKAIPVEQEKLVGIVKNASPELMDLLTVVNTAIEGTVLSEVGKNSPTRSKTDAWSKIEAKAAEIEKRDSVTHAKAISKAIKENPELYNEYLVGGAD